jgi:hypothetical protein
MTLLRPGFKTKFSRFFLTLLSIGVAFAGSASSLAQTTATNIQVTSAAQQSSVKRLGINLGDQTYWDSGQLMKNLVFRNPGFEAEKYRSIMICNTVTANTCTDDNQWSPQATGFWTGATYSLLSGKSVGASGTIVSSTKNPTSCSGCGQIMQFDQNVNPVVGDYFVVTQSFPGSGDAGWWDNISGGGTISTETTDLSPNTPGKQAVLISATAPGQSATLTQYFDNEAGLSFIQLNGAFEVTFRAKGAGGNNKLSVSVARLMPSGAVTYLNQSLTLTNAWQDYTLIFTANETGSASGTVQLVFGAKGSSVELDDVSLNQTNSSASNPTVFRDEVVNTLKELNPGTIRMMAAGAALGSDIPNQLQAPFARYREGYSTGSTNQAVIAYGIHEFLQLCQTVGADPWITIPTATTTTEMTDFIQYLTGAGSDQWSALRIARGQSQPWTTVFNKIHIEFGNETWNGSFRGESMNYNAYPQLANKIFGAARQTAGYKASSFDLVLDGFVSSPGYNGVLLKTSTQHDSIDIAPYLLVNANNEAQATLFGALFAEPELFESASGVVGQDMAQAVTAPTPTYMNVYETNLGMMGGTITQAQLNSLTPSVGAGLAHTDHMLQMMRVGVRYQNAFSLPQFDFKRNDGSLVRMWGSVVDMGTTNRRRPQFLTEALANSVIGGVMLQTVHTGANPTWNQPLSSDNVVLNGAHYLQSFAFLNGNAASAVIFNLNQTASLPVTFSGANAPSGSVQMSQITSANITDSNETADTVQTTTQTLSGFSPATGISLPPFSMTVLSWSASLTQAPTFSVPAGSYGAAQTVTITDGTPGAVIYYTTNGSAPTASSTKYTVAITVSATETLQAIAVAPNYNNSAVATAAYTIMTPSATPAFSVAAGTYASSQTVSITAATAGSSIYFTTNGSTPITSSSLYAGPIMVNATETLQAIAVASNYNNSAVASAAYTIMTPAATPVFSVAPGTYVSSQAVSISDATAGAIIYFTTNGSTPTTSSTKYTGAITVSATETLQAIAVASNYNNSAVASAAYTIMAPAAMPAFSVAAGTYASSQTVSITAATAGSSIYFTTNGSTPSTSSSLYAGPITVSATETLQAIAVAANYNNSAIAMAAYTIMTPAAMPVLSVAPGTYASSQTVSITAATAGSSIYFTTNGSTPGTSSSLYAGPITVNATETLQAIAVAANHNNSVVASAVYTIMTPAAMPAFSVASGTFASSQTISIAAATVGSSIFFTTNGSTPSTSSSLYAGPITVNATETLQAIAVAANYNNSVVAAAVYTIMTPAATPVFSVASGWYTGVQAVTITGATAGSSIYYTTDGSMPTTSSIQYTGPVSVSTSKTLQAVAVATNYLVSSMAGATYTIAVPTGIAFSNGFAGSKLKLNGTGTVVGNSLQLTNGGTGQAGSVWFPTKVSVNEFVTDFDFQLPTSVADGFTFTIQNSSKLYWALGNNGGGLGYQSTTNSVAVTFDLYQPGVADAEMVGVYTGGVSPQGNSVSLVGSGLNLHSGNPFHAHIVYSGNTLTLTLTDKTTSATVTKTFAVNIASSVGGTTAYVGFTGSTGAYTSIQNILDWTYTN